MSDKFKLTVEVLNEWRRLLEEESAGIDAFAAPAAKGFDALAHAIACVEAFEAAQLIVAVDFTPEYFPDCTGIFVRRGAGTYQSGDRVAVLRAGNGGAT